MSVQEIRSENGLKLVYFSHDDCNICKVLKPKVIQLMEKEFPNVGFEYVNIRKQPTEAAGFSVFTVPTVLLLADGREMVRFVRSFGLEQLRDKLQRYYQLYFG